MMRYGVNGDPLEMRDAVQHDAQGTPPGGNVASCEQRVVLQNGPYSHQDGVHAGPHLMYAAPRWLRGYPLRIAGSRGQPAVEALGPFGDDVRAF